MANTNRMTISDIKSALKDSRFRMSLPKEFSKRIEEFLDNPGCSCNIPLYRDIMRDCREQLVKYYPSKVPAEDYQINPIPVENRWSVINCGIEELHSKLMGLPPGRKQIGIARWEDQVTVIVNELEISL